MNHVYTCFPGGKFKCLTMSYDDGRNADRRLIDLFNRHGIKGTFHLNSGLAAAGGDRVPPEAFRQVYAGHEVSCHTVTHPTLARCPLPSVITEVLDDRRALEAAVGYPVRGLSYPNGSYNEEICDMLRHVGIRYSRVVGNSDSFAMPDDLMRWKATCHHNHNLMSLAEQFLALHKEQYQYLMYVWGHSYEFDRDDNWQLIEDFCAMMGGHDDIWYATNIEIVDYLDVFHGLQFAADNSFVYNPSAASAFIRVNGAEPIEIPGGTLVNL